MRAVLTGSSVFPSSACVSFSSNCADLDSNKLPDNSSNFRFDFPYVEFRVWAIASALSCTLLQLSNFLLKSSSLIPAQFNASASTPVTFATCADSFIDSVSDSIGIESPYADHTPMAEFAKLLRVSVDTFNPIKFVTAFVVI